MAMPMARVATTTKARWVKWSPLRRTDLNVGMGVTDDRKGPDSGRLRRGG
jgi:hypothetical protein